MPNLDVLNLGLFQSKMEKLIEIAMENPERYYKNFLKENEKYNPAKVPIFDEDKDEDKFIYCCIWAFVFTSLNGEELHKEYYKEYNEQIDKEIDALSICDKIEIKKSLERYPMIRCLLYKDEEFILKNDCHTIDDYLEYIDKHGDVCRELTLYAKYRISIIDDQSNNFGFDELIEVINDFPYSDLFDIDGLKSRCVSINGLMVCFNNKISQDIREAITNIIENSKQAHIDDEGYVYYVGKPLTKYEKILFQGYDCQVLKDIIGDFDESVLFRESEVTALLLFLKSATGLDWIIPDEQIFRENNQTVLLNNVWYKERRASLNIEEYYSLMPTIKTKNNG